MKVFLVNTKLFPVLGTHHFTSCKLLNGFKHLGYNTSEIDRFDNIEDDDENIFIMSNHCDIYHQEDEIVNGLNELSKKYVKSVFILWFFHKLASKNRIPLKNWILTGECFYERPKREEHIWYYEYQNSIDNYVPWRFAVSSSIKDIQKDYDNFKLNDIKYNACFMGTRYKPTMSNQINGVYYYDNSRGFLEESERVYVFKNSIIALGWHSDGNIDNNVIVERIFEGMRYGCVVVTDNPIVETITDGICIYVKSAEEVNQLIRYYKENPDKREEKVKKGLLWLIKKGTYSHVAQDFIRKINSNKKVLITGGCGFVGRHFTRKLREDGYHITCVDNLVSESAKHPSLWFNDFEFIEEDCREFFKKKLDIKYDIIIHLAAIVGGRANMEDHPMSVADDLSIDASMFTWAVKNKDYIGHIIYFSSSAAYPIEYQQDNEKQRVLSPDMINFYCMTIGQPDLTYGWSKLTGEYLALTAVVKYGLAISIYRPFSGYGEDQDEVYPFIGILKRVLRKENPVMIYSDSVRDFVHIDDIVAFVMKSYRRYSDGRGINIGSGRGMSFSQLAKLMAKINGYDADVQIFDNKPKGVHYRVSSTSIEQNISIEDGIKRAIEYLNSIKEL